MRVGIDIEQFVRDPYGSGIQRVLQYLAIEWPRDEVDADFVVPLDDGHALLSADQAAALLSLPFEPRTGDVDLRDVIRHHIDGLEATGVEDEDLLSIFDAWLLPEVSYLPSVLGRLERFGASKPTVMIGYDSLPMTEPANYRFPAGMVANVSEYFRHLASADVVVCISEYARDCILDRLRRDRRLPIGVAHPGGDHVAMHRPEPPVCPVFVRLGTLEARKRPVEIARAFQRAVVEHGIEAELVFIGAPSASDDRINRAIREAAATSRVRWVQGADDEEVAALVHASSAFLSIGVEGYGIPVLEALRLGTPVLFDGIQPAADLMVGRGARRVPAMTEDDLVSLFRTYSDSTATAELVAEVRPDEVPTWRDFAAKVAAAVGDPVDGHRRR